MRGAIVGRPNARGDDRARALLFFLAIVAYLILPNGNHPLAGVPLSIPNTIVLALALSSWWLAASQHAPRVILQLVAGMVALRLLATALPVPGFAAEYFPNAAFSGQAHSRIDSEIRFTAATFPRQVLTEFYWEGERSPQNRPFSARWHARLLLPSPASIAVRVVPADAVRVDGLAGPQTFAAGIHDIAVEYQCLGQDPPAIELTATDSNGGPLPVVAYPGQPSRRLITLASLYSRLAAAMDLCLLVMVMWLFSRSAAESYRTSREKLLPPLRLAIVATVFFWLIFGWLRTGPRLNEMIFFDPSDDWAFYNAAARLVTQGQLLGQPGPTPGASFLYAYALALLHLVFGDRIWALYFAQHAMLGGACVLMALVARRLWGQGRALAVLATSTSVALLDVSRYYVVRFLSENLLLVLVPLAFLALSRLVEQPRASSAFFAGVALAAVSLTRFNLIFYATAVVAYLLFKYRRQPMVAASLVAGTLGVYASFPLREYLATGRLALLPVNTYLAYRGELHLPWQADWGSILKTITLPYMTFLVLGIPTFWASYFSFKPHWALLWLAFSASIIGNWRYQSTMIWILRLYVAAYVVLLNIAPYQHSYGFRHILGLSFILALFAPDGLLVLWRSIQRRRSHGLASTAEA